MVNTKLVLASSSPRRKELLELTGLEFRVTAAQIDETPHPEEEPMAYVHRLACGKAEAIARSQHLQGELILAADTTVADHGELLGKPMSPAEANRILLQLRHRTHQVHTALVLLDPSRGIQHWETCTSQVPMRDYSEAEIQRYIESGDPIDKAGAYAIQNKDFHPVDGFSGCMANVMGLPLCHFSRSLEHFGLKPDVNIPEACQSHLDYNCRISCRVLKGDTIG